MARLQLTDIFLEFSDGSSTISYERCNLQCLIRSVALSGVQERYMNKRMSRQNHLPVTELRQVLYQLHLVSSSGIFQKGLILAQEKHQPTPGPWVH